MSDNEFSDNVYTIQLSPEWKVEIPTMALKMAGAYPHGELVQSEEAKYRLLRAALIAQEWNIRKLHNFRDAETILADAKRRRP